MNERGDGVLRWKKVMWWTGGLEMEEAVAVGGFCEWFLYPGG